MYLSDVIWVILTAAPQGHRTYPAFVHFLTCISLLAIYLAAVSIEALVYSFNNPYEVVCRLFPGWNSELTDDGLQDQNTPLHEVVLAGYGSIFAIVVGPFAAYHYYLIS